MMKKRGLTKCPELKFEKDLEWDISDALSPSFMNSYQQCHQRAFHYKNHSISVPTTDFFVVGTIAHALMPHGHKNKTIPRSWIDPAIKQYREYAHKQRIKYGKVVRGNQIPFGTDWRETSEFDWKAVKEQLATVSQNFNIFRSDHGREYDKYKFQSEKHLKYNRMHAILDDVSLDSRIPVFLEYKTTSPGYSKMTWEDGDIQMSMQAALVFHITGIWPVGFKVAFNKNWVAKEGNGYYIKEYDYQRPRFQAYAKYAEQFTESVWKRFKLESGNVERSMTCGFCPYTRICWKEEYDAYDKERAKREHNE